jgi:hypothetical protein
MASAVLFIWRFFARHGFARFKIGGANAKFPDDPTLFRNGVVNRLKWSTGAHVGDLENRVVVDVVFLKRGPMFDFKNILDEFICRKMAFFAQTTACFWKKNKHNIGFWENANFFSPKIGANPRKNNDYNIAPLTGEIW